MTRMHTRIPSYVFFLALVVLSTETAAFQLKTTTTRIPFSKLSIPTATTVAFPPRSSTSCHLKKTTNDEKEKVKQEVRHHCLLNRNKNVSISCHRLCAPAPSPVWVEQMTMRASITGLAQKKSDAGAKTMLRTILSKNDWIGGGKHGHQMHLLV